VNGYASVQHIKIESIKVILAKTVQKQHLTAIRQLVLYNKTTHI